MERWKGGRTETDRVKRVRDGRTERVNRVRDGKEMERLRDGEKHELEKGNK